MNPIKALKINFLIAILFFLFGFFLMAIFVFPKNKQLRQERENLITAHKNELRRVRNEQGQQRTIAPVAQLSPETLRQINAAHLREIEQSFDVKIKRMESLMKLSVSTQGKAKMRARDTNIVIFEEVENPIAQPVKQYAYRDNYFSMNAFATADSLFVTNYKVRNEITAITYRDKRRYWWKFWKPRQVRCQVFLFNPNSGTDTLEVQTLNK